MSKSKKNKTTPDQHNAFKHQYEFAVEKCGHHVTAKTVAVKFKKPARWVYSAYYRGGDAAKMEAITAEYARQISEFVKNKGYEFAVLSAAQIAK
jgi:hypothetical protein